MKNNFLISCITIPMLLTTVILTGCSKGGGGDAPSAPAAPGNPGNKPCASAACFPAQKPNPISDQQLEAFAVRIQSIKLDMISALRFRQVGETSEERRAIRKSLGTTSREFYNRIFACQPALNYNRNPYFPQAGQPYTETIQTSLMAFNFACPVQSTRNVTASVTSNEFDDKLTETVSGSFDYNSKIVNFQNSELVSTTSNGTFNRTTKATYYWTGKFFKGRHTSYLEKRETFNEYGTYTMTSGAPINVAVTQKIDSIDEIDQPIPQFSMSKSFRFIDGTNDVLVEVIQSSIDAERVYQINGVVYPSDKVHRLFDWLSIAERVPMPSSEYELDAAN